MNAMLSALAAVWIFLLAVPVLVLLVQVLAGWRAARPQATPGTPKPVPYGVLIPAHDEAGTIGATIAAVRGQLPPGGPAL